MSEAAERLEDLARRLDRASTRPAEAAEAFSRVASFVLRAVRWRPALATAALDPLVAFLREGAADEGPEARADRLDALLAPAIDEAEANVGALERACAVRGRAPFALVCWLSRALRFLARLEGTGRVLAGDPTRAARLGAAEAVLLAPLAPSAGRADDEPGLEVELAALDHLIEAARGEVDFLSRRRRLLEAARRSLLDLSAAGLVEGEAVERRLGAVAAEITLLDRVEAAGVSPDVALAHQARAAFRRGDRQRLVAALVALDAMALGAGAVRRAERAASALDELARAGVFDPAARAESAARSAAELLGAPAVEAITAARAEARARAHGSPPASADERELQRVARAHFASGEEELLRAAVLADGLFDVGGALSPVRVTEIETRARLVSHPTQELVLVQARAIEDVQHAVVTDPRAVLLDLAAGRLLARRYVQLERRDRTKTRLAGELRVYVLDGSTSMVTEGSGRARTRDAILLAELATVLRRLEEGDRFTRVRLAYRFFTAELQPLREVATPRQALDAIAEVAGTPRAGGTDIQRALLSSFELIRAAREADEALAKAQIVLVTDGQAPVDEEAVEQARAAAGALPVSFSVIALGEENPALRALCARQRARGERSFYHHLSDEVLAGLAEDRLLPCVHARAPAPDAEGALPGALAAALDELAADDEDAVSARVRDELREGPFAREEALLRDGAALGRRFDRWFPAPRGAAPPGAREAAPPAPEDAEVLAVLSALAEIVGDFGGAPLARQADAIELLERLLPDAGLSPLRYLARVEAPSPAVAAALAAARVAAGR